MTKPKAFSQSMLHLVRHLSETPYPASLKEIEQDTGLNRETIRYTLRNWPEYFATTGTRPERFSLDITNPDARAVARQYANGVEVSKKNSGKKWYFLKESDYEVCKSVYVPDLLQRQSQLWASNLIDISRKEEIRKVVHKLEGIIYNLMEKEYPNAQ